MIFGWNWVTSRLAIGGAFEGPQDAETLLGAGITHVINCTEFDDPVYVTGMFQYCWAKPAKPDDGTPRTLDWFRDGGLFWLPVATSVVVKTYVHCSYGLERSHAMVVYMLMRLGLSLDDAWLLICRHRPVDVIGVRYLDEAKAAAQMVGQVVASTVSLCSQ